MNTKIYVIIVKTIIDIATAGYGESIVGNYSLWRLIIR